MVTYLCSLAQLCCGEGGALQANLTGVCGERSQYLSHTGLAPAHGACAFPIYTAQAPDCSAGELSKVGPGLHALPRSKLLRFRFSGIHKGADSVGPAFCALPRSEQLRRQVPGERPLPGCSASYRLPIRPLGFLGAQRECRLRCVPPLLWGADLWLQPSRQMPTVQDPSKTCLATGSLLAVW